jgi:hypothetical protein
MWVLALAFGSVPAVANESDINDGENPSADFLEFLADFDGVEDDETFDLLIENGLNDYEKSQAQEESELLESADSEASTEELEHE